MTISVRPNLASCSSAEVDRNMTSSGKLLSRSPQKLAHQGRGAHLEAQTCECPYLKILRLLIPESNLLKVLSIQSYKIHINTSM